LLRLRRRGRTARLYPRVSVLLFRRSAPSRSLRATSAIMVNGSLPPVRSRAELSAPVRSAHGTGSARFHQRWAKALRGGRFVRPGSGEGQRPRVNLAALLITDSHRYGLVVVSVRGDQLREIRQACDDPVTCRFYALAFAAFTTALKLTIVDVEKIARHADPALYGGWQLRLDAELAPLRAASNKSCDLHIIEAASSRARTKRPAPGTWRAQADRDAEEGC
jgi:hypothetical protein